MAQIQVTGNVGKDPELKFFNGKNGDFAVTKFPLAETERIKKGDEWVDGDTVWYSVNVTGRLAETLVDSISKGQKVFVDGDLKQFSYEKDGETKSGLEIRAKIVAIIPTATKTTKKTETEEAWPF